MGRVDEVREIPQLGSTRLCSAFIGKWLRTTYNFCQQSIKKFFVLLTRRTNRFLVIPRRNSDILFLNPTKRLYL